jgi:predicted aspartyl protease
MDQPIFRPFVEVSLAHAGETTTVLDGLVDTGADAILASDLLAEQLGIDLEDNEGETSHGVGCPAAPDSPPL